MRPAQRTAQEPRISGVRGSTFPLVQNGRTAQIADRAKNRAIPVHRTPWPLAREGRLMRPPPSRDPAEPPGETREPRTGPPPPPLHGSLRRPPPLDPGIPHRDSPLATHSKMRVTSLHD